MKMVIKRATPADAFTILPNDLLRRGGPTKLTLRARAMLAALVSYSDGWEIDRAELEAIAPELGEDAIDTVRDELISKGHLQTTRRRCTGGRFVWTWYVSVYPFTEATSSSENDSESEFSQFAPSVDQPPMVEPRVDQPPVANPPINKRPTTTTTKRPAPKRPTVKTPPPPPPPRTPLPAGSAHPASAGVADDPVGNTKGSAAAEALLAGLGSRWAKLGRRDAAGLIPRVAEALAEGWSAEALAEYLTADPPARIGSVGALLRVRLDNLPIKPPAIPAPRNEQRPRRTVDPLADYQGSTAATRSADADAVVAAIRAKVPKGKPLRRR